MRKLWLTVGVIWVGLPPTGTWAQNSDPLPIPRITSKVVVDGVIDEAIWNEALVVAIAYETRPGENIAPPVKTDVLLMHDDNRLLVAFRCQDPEPDKIRARVSARDKLWNDDYVSVVLDTFNDQRRAYEFSVNPLGIQLDAINDEVGRNYDLSWNAVWTSAGRVTKKGYDIEFSIPFHQLRFQPTADAQVWGFDAYRSYPRKETHLLSITAEERGNNSYLGQLPKLVGFEGVDPGRNLKLAPTLTAGQTDARPDPDSGFETVDEDVQAGLTLTWGMTPNWTLSGTLNPDFSQVEADVIQLDVNETFALFFPETRPFFLEGADAFNTTLNLVHTRTVADPSGALKIGGKEGRHLATLFTARDEITNILIPGAESSSSGSFTDPNTATTARYRYDLSGNSTIGALVTDRRGQGGYFNRLLSLDANLRFTTKHHLEAQFSQSRTRYSSAMREALDLERGELDDRALTLRYRHSRRKWQGNAAYSDFGEDFRADMGFLPRVDRTRWEVGSARTWYGEEGDFLNRISLGTQIFSSQTQAGRLLNEGYSVRAALRGSREFRLNMITNRGRQRFNGVNFDLQNIFLRSSFRPSRSLSVGLNGNFGDAVDFTHTRPGDRFQISPVISLNAGKRAAFALTYSLTGLDVEGGRLFTTQVSELRSTYNLSRRSFVRAVLQYVDVERDQELYASEVEARNRDLLTQLLFSYEISPQTALFVGYSDSSIADDEIESLTRVDRTFFLKVGYAWLQ